MESSPSLEEIRACRRELAAELRETPVWRWDAAAEGCGARSVWSKWEFLQHAGAFKYRGVAVAMRNLSDDERRRGVTAISAGNHALAVAFGAARAGVSAKVVIPKTVNPARLEGCRRFGAEVVLVNTLKEGFEQIDSIVARERRTLLHPFESRAMILGGAMLGDEWLDQTGELDVILVPVGGGGLLAGVALAAKERFPKCRVIGVEPVGADSMYRSFASGKPEKLEAVNTIADSLGAPYAAPLSFGVCKRYADEIMRVTDDEICSAMRRIFSELHLALEPAAAATTAALVGPCRESVHGARVGVLFSGTNINPATYAKYLQREV